MKQQEKPRTCGEGTGGMMRVKTTRFGELDIPEEATLEFPRGIFGFPELRRCCLLPYGSTRGLRWLQSLEDPTLLFLTMEPYLVFPEYEAEVPEHEAAALGLERPEEAAVLTLVTISPETEAMTTNLMAPIVINTKTRRGRQVIVEGDRYLTKHLIGGEIKDGFDAGIDAESW